MTKIPPAPLAVSVSDEGHDELVVQGRELFHTKGNCAQCHGATGMGDGQAGTFDATANDWIKAPGVDPRDRKTYREFSAAGALPPRPVRPRNLNLPVYRGGSHPNDLYLRIANGIEGTPMPSSPVLTPEETWAIVAYVKSLPFQHVGTQPVKPEAQPTIAK
jgi:mono/diheme cytochrome c family protein